MQKQQNYFQYKLFKIYYNELSFNGPKVPVAEHSLVVLTTLLFKLLLCTMSQSSGQ